MSKSSKIARTIYLTPTIDTIINERKTLEDRTMSAQIEHMIKKCLDYELKEDLKSIELSEKQP